MGGLQATTDFLGLKGTTDTLGEDIAHFSADPRTKPLLPLPSAGQNVGAALQVGSFLIPATGAERIAAQVGEGALTRAAVSGAISGAEYGATSGAGTALTAKPEATDKEILTEAAKQGAIGTVAGGALGIAGSLAGKGIAKLLGEAKPVEAPTAPLKVPVESEGIQNNIPVSTPNTRAATYAKSQGYEPYTPPEQLPTIDTGPAAKSNLPTIQTEPKPSNKLGDLTVEPLKVVKAAPVAPKEPNVVVPKTTVASKIDERLAPIADKEGNVTVYRAAPEFPTDTFTKDTHFATKPETARYYSESHYKGEPSDISVREFKVPASLLKRGGSNDSWQLKEDYPVSGAPKVAPQSIGTAKVSKISKSINAKSVENGLTSGFKDLAGYEPKVIKDQAEKISNLMSDNMDNTRAIIRGEKPVPDGVSGTYLVKAAEDHAIATGNGEMLRELASSPLTSETSRFAQELRMAAERNPESPLKAISDINKARESKAARTTDVPKAKKATVSDIKEEIRKAAPKKEDWNSFIDTLTC